MLPTQSAKRLEVLRLYRWDYFMYNYQLCMNWFLIYMAKANKSKQQENVLNCKNMKKCRRRKKSLLENLCGLFLVLHINIS